jgi:hypothetical protein
VSGYQLPALGIIDDDVVHIVSKFREAVQRDGTDPLAALPYVMQTAGRDVVVTSVALIAGFVTSGGAAAHRVRRMTQAEAAGHLGLSVSGTKSRVQRARLHLRSALDDCCRIALDRRGGVLGYEGCGDQCGSCDCGSVSNQRHNS